MTWSIDKYGKRYDPNEQLQSFRDATGRVWRKGQPVIIYDAWQKNPVRCKIAFLMHWHGDGAVVGENRTGRIMAPLGPRVILCDLFHPVTREELSK
jgi:hypothetical protein